MLFIKLVVFVVMAAVTGYSAYDMAHHPQEYR